MELKKCTKCKEDKSISEYNKNKSKKGGLNNICRSCSNSRSREYYTDKTTEHKVNVRARIRKLRQINRKNIIKYYETHPCVGCGEEDYIVLDFDHRDGVSKKENVSTLLSTGYKWETILEEIDKCDVRCANCHRRRTAKQFGWYK